MSKIHTALKASAVNAPGASPPQEVTCSSLDKKLIAAGIAPEVLSEAHSLNGGNGGGFFDQLIRKKAIDEIQLLKILAGHFGLLFLSELPMESINIDFTQNVSISYLKKHKIVPLITSADAVIAVNDPANFQPVDDLRNLLKNSDLPVVLATQEAIMAAINLAYDMSRSTAKDYFEEMSEASADELISEINETADLLDETSDAPIIKLVNLLVAGALRTTPAGRRGSGRASDSRGNTGRRNGHGWRRGEPGSTVAAEVRPLRRVSRTGWTARHLLPLRLDRATRRRDRAIAPAS